ncbi:AC_N domain-containing protein [Trichonephila clavata]|uniref:AC_N domain-containing protein n=1 Tax=Trichonephila clavata TaxID=2740835 RepID=A0A8X6G8X4_TRICU|nr:AC_N domain-containing protein [Trichonephila clavata]
MSGLELIARDSKSEIERNAEAATVYFSAVQNKDDDERNWSFSYLREQLLLKDSQELFRRYQVRVQHALFVELLVFNLVYNAIAFGAFIILPNQVFSRFNRTYNPTDILHSADHKCSVAFPKETLQRNVRCCCYNS